jgi:hypothetical protein
MYRYGNNEFLTPNTWKMTRKEGNLEDPLITINQGNQYQDP